MFEMKQIGKNIAGLRRRADMTQMQLAEILQVSYQAVSSWERGLTMPDIAKLPELAAVFLVSIDALFSQEKGEFGGVIAEDQSKAKGFGSSELLKENSSACNCPLIRELYQLLEKKAMYCTDCPLTETRNN